MADKFVFMFKWISSMPDNERHYKAYEAIWRNMERENALINFRIQWAIALSGGILATEGVLATTLKEPLPPSPDLTHGLTLLLMFFLSTIALAFCWKSREGVWAAQNQIDELKRHYYTFQKDNGANIFEADLALPRPFGNRISHSSGHTVAVTFPMVLVTVWLIFGALEFTGAVVFLYRSYVSVADLIVKAPAAGAAPEPAPVSPQTPPQQPQPRRGRVR